MANRLSSIGRRVFSLAALAVVAACGGAGGGSGTPPGAAFFSFEGTSDLAGQLSVPLPQGTQVLSCTDSETGLPVAGAQIQLVADEQGMLIFDPAPGYQSAFRFVPLGSAASTPLLVRADVAGDVSATTPVDSSGTFTTTYLTWWIQTFMRVHRSNLLRDEIADALREIAPEAACGLALGVAKELFFAAATGGASVVVKVAQKTSSYLLDLASILQSLNEYTNDPPTTRYDIWKPLSIYCTISFPSPILLLRNGDVPLPSTGRGAVHGQVAVAGTARSGATVRLQAMGMTNPSEETTTDAAGSFRFPSKPVGAYILRVSAIGAKGSLRTTVVSVGGDAEENFDLVALDLPSALAVDRHSLDLVPGNWTAINIYNRSAAAAISWQLNGGAPWLRTGLVTNPAAAPTTPFTTSGTLPPGRSAIVYVGADALAAGSTQFSVQSSTTGQDVPVSVAAIIGRETVRVSLGSTNNELDGASNDSSSSVRYPRQFVSADGARIAFESSATNAVAGDTNGVSDVFLRDVVTYASGNPHVSGLKTPGTLVAVPGDAHGATRRGP